MRALLESLVGIGDEVRRLQDNIKVLVSRIYDLCPFLDGKLITGNPELSGITLGAGATVTISHYLGRRYRGFLVVSSFGTDTADLRAVRGTEEFDTYQANIYSRNNCKVFLWFW